MTSFKTRKRDGQVFPTDRKTPRDSGSPQFVGVDKSQISSETKLEPRYDSRKSFYGKATQRTENGKIILESYGTDVAYIENGKAVVKGSYSPTTTRHIKEFLKQNGFKVESTKQMLKDYSNDKPTKPRSVGVEKQFSPSMSQSSMGSKFEISKGVTIIARTTDSKDGFNHVADLYKDGVKIGTSKVHYINRTWEQYEYESVISNLLDKKGVSQADKKVIMNTTKNLAIGKIDKEFKSVAMISSLGNLFHKDDIKERNKWKLRMLKAGLEKKGLQIPDDFDKLSEKDKEARLDAVIEQMKDTKK